MREATQMEVDLMRHMKDKIFQVLDDFCDTAERVDIPTPTIAVLIISCLIDLGISGMMSLSYDKHDIYEVLKTRADMQLDMEKRRKKRP